MTETVPARRNGGLWSRLAFAAYLVVAVVVLLELALRGYFALQIGPRVLAYGTPWYRNDFEEYRIERLIEQYDREFVVWNENENKLDLVSKHNNVKDGYRKFFPNETKFFKDIDSGEIVPVTINSHGFRGKDFSIVKPDGVLRVLTLGASSTFGFYSRDEETYPYLLEQRLNARCHGSKRYEVINFAIPHARSDAIRAMFTTEGIALNPDIITFYEGRNDSYRIHPMDIRQVAEGAQIGWLRGAWHEMTQTLVLARLLDGLSQTRTRFSADEALESLRNLSATTSRNFIANLEKIRKLAEHRNIPIIVANQQANSKSWFGIPEHQRQSMRGVTYSDEVSAIERILERGEPISGYEFNFLIHNRLMGDLEAWAHEKKVPFVDIIGVLDQERHHLVSWVHLDAYANGLVADALADEIVRLSCSDQTKRD